VSAVETAAGEKEMKESGKAIQAIENVGSSSFFPKERKTVMKRTLTTLLALGTLAILSVPAKAGTATNSLTVQANVANNCKVTAATLNFGAYDPVVANATTDLTAQQALTINCTKDTAATSIDLDNGIHASGAQRRMTNGSDNLNYNLFKDSARTSNWTTGAVNGVVPDASTSKNTALTSGGNPIVVYGTVPQNQDVSAGSYSDTVTITINF
jgi:spore coat protein U domain-containing protein, fimbrial subunit CupE1/2/3/6